MEPEYRERIEQAAISKGYKLYYRRRHERRKDDALVLAIDEKQFEVRETSHVELCRLNDRVGQIVWLYHKHAQKNFVIANTHLSFPHNEFDRMQQYEQINKLTSAIASFARHYLIFEASDLRMIY